MRRDGPSEYGTRNVHTPDHTYLILAACLAVICYILLNVHFALVYVKHHDNTTRLEDYRVANESQVECAHTRVPKFLVECEKYKLILRRPYWLETLRLAGEEEMNHLAFDILGVRNWFTIGTWGDVQMVKIIESVVDVWQAIMGSARLLIAALVAWGVVTLIAMLIGLLSTCHLCAKRRRNIEEERRIAEQHINHVYADPVQQIIQLAQKSKLDYGGTAKTVQHRQGFRLGGNDGDEQKYLPNVVPWMNA